ncbi:hypothetical protein KGQ20_46680, partial [Catenulispora sp. NF23]
PPPPGAGGTVTCVSGNAVEGVWVQADQGSGFAAWQPTVSNGSTARYSLSLPLYENYSLHVGCGGTPANWGWTVTTQDVGGNSNNFLCYDVQGEQSTGYCTLP